MFEGGCEGRWYTWYGGGGQAAQIRGRCPFAAKANDRAASGPQHARAIDSPTPQLRLPSTTSTAGSAPRPTSATTFTLRSLLSLHSPARFSPAPALHDARHVGWPVRATSGQPVPRRSGVGGNKRRATTGRRRRHGRHQKEDGRAEYRGRRQVRVRRVLRRHHRNGMCSPRRARRDELLLTVRAGPNKMRQSRLP